MRKKIRTIFISGLIVFSTCPPVMAAGKLKKLQGLAENMNLQQEVLKEETKNYQKAEQFIESPEIKKALSSEYVLEKCGPPVAKADQGKRWVYKPPTSTFFKGEKIYFIFDEHNRLTGWEKLNQQ